MIRLFVLAILMFFGLRLWAVGNVNAKVDDGPDSATKATYAHGGECNGKCAPYIRQQLTLGKDPADTGAAKMVYAETKGTDKPAKSEVIDESGKKK